MRAMVRTRSQPSETVEDDAPEVYPEPDERDIGDLAALAAADSGWHWQVHRIKSQDEISKNRRGKERIWVTAITGAVDLQDFHARHGGGVYEFWGSVGGQLTKKVTLELDGLPRIRTVSDPTPATTPLVNGELSRGERLMLKMIRLQERRIQQIERTAAPIEKPSSITELVSALGTMDELRQRGQPVTDQSIAKELFQSMTTAMQKGIELGQGRDPIPAGEGGTDWLKVAETFVPLAGRVLDRMAQSRPVARAASPPRARTASAAGAAPPTPDAASGSSSAEVIENDVVVTATPAITTARWMVVMDLLAQGVREAAPREDVADMIAEILPDGELEAILQLPDQAVVNDIAAKAGGQYPELVSEAGMAYVASILIELKRSPNGDPEPES